MSTSGYPRLPIIDAARGLALLAMAIYHFTWDLEFFGYAPPGLTFEPGWKLFARCIASSFLFLVGVSLVLAHGRGIGWPGFRRRWLMIAASAGAISLLTWLALPQGFIFFGILHQIALASLLGLAFLRLPALLTLTAAASVVALPLLFRSVAFDAPWLWWVGLSATIPLSNDYVPLFPWFGAVLAGIGAARLAERLGLFGQLARIAMPRAAAPIALAGRHSLLVYLVHQPLLIGGLWLFAQIAPPVRDITPEAFLPVCQRSCEVVREREFCERYCACVVDRLVAEDRLDDALDEGQNEETRRWLTGVAEQCSAQVAAPGEMEESR